MNKYRLLVLFSFFLGPLCSQNLTSNTTGSFIYTPTGVLSSKSIKVYYHIPNGDIKTMPVVFSFHGVNRNADDYRDYWISMANVNNFMVFAPQFSNNDFPTGDAYNLANIFDDGDNPSSSTFNPKAAWTFSVLDPLFEQIKSDISGTQQKYNAWGHSAGAQFLHRFVMYLPNSKLDIAVCSNAGWYTVPEFSVDFPYGIQKGQLPNNDLKTAFTKKLIVHLGKDDNDSNASGLRRNSIVDNQQGLHRFERGNYFFSKSNVTAQGLNTPFNWEKDEVTGVAHEAQKMANDALEHVLKSTLSAENYIKKNIILYPNPVKEFLYFDNSSIKLNKVTVFSILGKRVATIYFDDFLTTQKVDFSKLSKGVYFLKGKDYIKKVMKE